MSPHVPKRLLMLLTAAAVALVPAAPAWAPHIAQINLAPDIVRAGDEMIVSAIRGFGKTNPVQIRLDAVDGPVLAEAETNDEFFAALPPTTITIPENITPGKHVIVVTQNVTDEETHIRGVPARAAFTVVTDSVNAPVHGDPIAGPVAVDARAASVQVLGADDVGDGIGGPLLVGLGVFGTALFLAAASVLTSVSRREVNR